jgi:hypothetical protein
VKRIHYETPLLMASTTHEPAPFPRFLEGAIANQWWNYGR